MGKRPEGIRRRDPEKGSGEEIRKRDLEKRSGEGIRKGAAGQKRRKDYDGRRVDYDGKGFNGLQGNPGKRG